MIRRRFLELASASLPLFAASTGRADRPVERATRGVVLYPFDLTLADWPERVHRAGLTTIGLHASRRFDVLRDFITSIEGKKFLDRCAQLGISVEYELHAMGELLSRELFFKDPKMFRMDEQGLRNIDSNCCPHSQTALEIISDKAVEWARVLTPTSHRYFYWPDDGAHWCRCPRCRDFSPSDQALLVENSILRALRSFDSLATLSHISYSYTLPVPRQVQPEAGIFLEFAPIQRDYTHSIADRDAVTKVPTGQPDPATNGGYLDILRDNMAVFGAEQTQVLEYWLDVSLHSLWRRPAVKLPWNAAICRSDIAAYRQLGVRHFSTFATFIDADYATLHGDPQIMIDGYGEGFQAP